MPFPILGPEARSFTFVARDLMVPVPCFGWARVDEAISLAQEGVAAAPGPQTIERHWGRVLTSIGLVALSKKEPPAAEAYLWEAVDIAHELKDWNLESPGAE